MVLGWPSSKSDESVAESEKIEAPFSLVSLLDEEGKVDSGFAIDKWVGKFSNEYRVSTWGMWRESSNEVDSELIPLINVKVPVGID